jgi:hypothetical protein
MEDITVKDIIRLAGKHWILGISVAILVFAIAAALIYRQEYSATSYVIISGDRDLFGDNAVRSGDLETQRLLMSSEEVMGPVRGLGNFDADISVVRNSNAIQIDTKAGSREIAVEAADGIALSYVNYSTRLKSKEAMLLSNMIDSQIKEYGQEIASLLEEQQLTAAGLEKQKREIAAKERVYQRLLERQEELRLSAVPDAIAIPAESEEAGKAAGLALGALLAFGVGIGSAVFYGSRRDCDQERMS